MRRSHRGCPHCEQNSAMRRASQVFMLICQKGFYFLFRGDSFDSSPIVCYDSRKSCYMFGMLLDPPSKKVLLCHVYYFNLKSITECSFPNHLQGILLIFWKNKLVFAHRSFFMYGKDGCRRVASAGACRSPLHLYRVITNFFSYDSFHALSARAISSRLANAMDSEYGLGFHKQDIRVQQALAHALTD